MKKVITTASILCLCLMIMAGCSAEDFYKNFGYYGSGTEIEVIGGKIQGDKEDGVRYFKGVPFAKAPTGELRFAPPQPVENWEGTLDCTEYRDMPVQDEDVHEADLTYSEDCLYLNIWAPEDVNLKNAPVLVFIHGGAYSQGAAGKAMYEGTRFAKDGVIQVNIEYRLNALGFLTDESIEEEYGTLGNAGVLDQIAGLKWVKENIAAFGGNPDNITISGESAGAYSVSNLVLSPLAKGLFNKAIMESGNILGQPMVAPTANGDPQQALETTNRLYQTLGVSGIDQARKISAQAIADASEFNMDMTNPTNLSFWPIFDGKVIPENPYEALKNGEHNRVDILAGYNTDEGTLFIPDDLTKEEYEQYVRVVFGNKADQVLARFPVDATHSPSERGQYIAKMGLRFGSDIFADELTKQGQTAYYYHFAYDIPEMDELGLGTMHAMELPFVFDTLPEAIKDAFELTEFTETVHNYWLNFIIFGDPNSGVKTPEIWPEYDAEHKETIVLGNKITTETAENADDVAFFKDLIWE